MSKLLNFVYCLSVERENEKVSASNILSILTPEFIPGSFSFAIVFSISDVNPTEKNTIKVIFKNSEEDITLVDSGEIIIPAPETKDGTNLLDEKIGLDLSMDLRNVVFEKEGFYTTQIFFNGELIGEREIRVKGNRNGN